MQKAFDIGIIGMGVAGVFAAYKLATQHKRMRVLGIDLGRAPAKRRRALEGWLGCLPFSDGKLYLNDISKVTQLVGTRKSKAAYTYVTQVLSNINNFEVIPDRAPNAMIEKRFNKIGYQINLNDYLQMYPKDIHTLSKYVADTIETNQNVTFNFDQEIRDIRKNKNIFVLTTTENKVYRCKKLILAVGRSGWRWAKEVFASFGIIEENDTARYGLRIEMNADQMKDFNKSNCSLIKGSEIELGPLSWFGTVIPEDHLDMAISSYRSNETRWKSNKVSFNLIGHLPYPTLGFEQTDRIGKLTFVITNDRVIRERVSYLLNDKAKISILPDYQWLKPVLTELSEAMPEILTKAYYHSPTIIPLAPQIKIGDNLSTEIDGMFVVGESAGSVGILHAAMTGAIAADTICK
jgi:uncharacterized FAD-dependent dehydrogenase